MPIKTDLIEKFLSNRYYRIMYKPIIRYSWEIQMMENFIVQYFLDQKVTIYCGLLPFKGKVKQCENGIVQLEIIPGRYTSISIDKIITITS
jgi:hypothetical protein